MKIIKITGLFLMSILVLSLTSCNEQDRLFGIEFNDNTEYVTIKNEDGEYEERSRFVNNFARVIADTLVPGLAGGKPDTEKNARVTGLIYLGRADENDVDRIKDAIKSLLIVRPNYHGGGAQNNFYNTDEDTVLYVNQLNIDVVIDTGAADSGFTYVITITISEISSSSDE